LICIELCDMRSAAAGLSVLDWSCGLWLICQNVGDYGSDLLCAHLHVARIDVVILWGGITFPAVPSVNFGFLARGSLPTSRVCRRFCWPFKARAGYSQSAAGGGRCGTALCEVGTIRDGPRDGRDSCHGREADPADCVTYE
jgi:hypothetical protein